MRTVNKERMPKIRTNENIALSKMQSSPEPPSTKLIKNKLNYLSTNLTDNNILNLVRYKFLIWGILVEGI